MAFKFIALAALVAVAQAGIVPTAYTAPLAYAHAPALAPAYAPVAKTILAKQIEYDPHPQYSYSYDVQDAHTGDYKSQHETRDGDVVRGSYSLLEADGTRRIVEYTADAHNGFNAIVRKEGTPILTKTIAAAPVLTKTYAAAPILTKTIAAPLAYAPAPIAKYHAAPAIAAYQAAPAYHQGYY